MIHRPGHKAGHVIHRTKKVGSAFYMLTSTVIPVLNSPPERTGTDFSATSISRPASSRLTSNSFYILLLRSSQLTSTVISVPLSWTRPLLSVVGFVDEQNTAHLPV